MTKEQVDQKVAHAKRAMAAVRSKMEARWAEAEVTGEDPGSIESVCGPEWEAAKAVNLAAIEALQAQRREIEAERKRLKAANDLKARAVELLEAECDRIRAERAARGQ